jgi:hypothetical protein
MELAAVLVNRAFLESTLLPWIPGKARSCRSEWKWSALAIGHYASVTGQP